eukprot:104675-Prymnesium_polylepis.2
MLFTHPVASRGGVGAEYGTCPPRDSLDLVHDRTEGAAAAISSRCSAALSALPLHDARTSITVSFSTSGNMLASAPTESELPVSCAWSRWCAPSTCDAWLPGWR